MKKKDTVEKDFMGEKDLSKKFWGLRIFAGVVIAVLLAGGIYIGGVKRFHSRELAKVKAEYHAINQRVSVIESTKKKRIHFFKNRFFLDFPYKCSFSGANFIRRLSLIPSSGIKITEIEIKPAGQHAAFSIAGSVGIGSKLIREAKFFRFYREIETFDEVMLVTSKKNWEEARGGGLYFTISGEIVLE